MAAGLGGIIAYSIAVATTSGRHSLLLFWIFGGLVVVGLITYLACQEQETAGASATPRAPAVPPTASEPADLDQDRMSPGVRATQTPTEPRPDSAVKLRRAETFTGLWRHTSDGFEASPLMTMANLAMSGYRGSEKWPFVRLGIAVACDRLAVDADSSPRPVRSSSIFCVRRRSLRLSAGLPVVLSIRFGLARRGTA